MSRDIRGGWGVKFTLEDGTKKGIGPMPYIDASLCTVSFGQGVLYDNQRVVRAKLFPWTPEVEQRSLAQR